MNHYTLCDAIPMLQSMKPKSVDLIFTSMPDLSQTSFGKCKEAYQQWQDNVLCMFANIVKDTGFIIICQTDRKLNAEILTNHVTYINGLTKYGLKVKDEKILVRNSVGQKSMYYMSYQYLTVFTRKGTFKRSGEFLKDIIVDKQVKCPPKTNQYCWSEDFASLVIKTLSKEGDLVLDPFAAAGIVPYVAGKLNRRYLAYEIEESMYNPNFDYFEQRLF